MSLKPLTTFTIKVKMTSDWHVGSGSGYGEIDSAVQRDSDELPYVPAKTLTGILRDGCEQVAQALDENSPGKWHQWVNLLFGDQPALAEEAVEPEPRPAIVSIRSAYLEHKLQEALKAKPKLANAITFVKPGVAIDPETGSAKPNFLRFEEVVRMDAVLIAQNCLLDFSEIPDIDDNGKRAACALLIAGTKMVERLGGKRRRGNGNCTIEIDSASQSWLQWLQDNHEQVKEPPHWKQAELPTTQADNPTANSTWVSVPLAITTKSPIVLPARTVGNVVECLDYIPGRYLLRYLHKKLGNQFNVSQAIARGDLIITNATIEIDGEAGRPTPFCLFGEKLDGGLSKGKGVYNRFKEEEPKKIQLKGERGGYLGKFSSSELPEYETLSLELYTHNTVMDEVQRPTSDVGGVYSYQAIPAGKTLKAELRIPKSIKDHLDSISKNWWENLNGELCIGQSKKDQYGLIEISTNKPQPVEHQSSQSKHSELYVWFLADVLLRNERLNPTTDPDDFRKQLESSLGVTLEERQFSSENHDQLSVMLRSRRTESWQVRWGLPRPSMLGWQAGSCVVYQVVQGEIKSEKLAELEAKGIGDRRAEGYGQISFNDSLLMNKLSSLKREKTEPQSKSSNLQPIPQGDPGFGYARTIERAAWREAIQTRALAIAANSQKRKEILGIAISGTESYPSMSQLGGLRSVMRRLTAREQNNPVTHWISAIQEVDNRKEKWPEGSLNAIKKLATDFDLVWKCLDFDQKQIADLTTTANAKTKLQADLWAEAVRTLADAMIRAHKRDWEKVN